MIALGIEPKTRRLVVFIAVQLFAACTALAHGRELTLGERVNAQRAIERVYHSHQTESSRSFTEAVPRALLEKKVTRYLQQSAALEKYWQTPVTGNMLARELDRMTRGTQMPERLRELFAALNNDPIVIQETLVRSVLVERLIANFHAFDRRIHGSSHLEATMLRDALVRGELDPTLGHSGRAELARTSEPPHSLAPGEVSSTDEQRDAFLIQVGLPEDSIESRSATYRIEKRPLDDWLAEVADGLNVSAVPTVAVPDFSRAISRIDNPLGGGCIQDDTWDNGSLPDRFSPRGSHTAVWTGTLMLIWGGGPVYGGEGVAVDPRGARYDPATDSWTYMSTDGAPSARHNHTAVWTGSEMVIWGGMLGFFGTNSGGRYNPTSDSWLPTSLTGAPPIPNQFPTAIWTGSRMIVFGGHGSTSLAASYDPSMDSWSPISAIDRPSPRFEHTAVWTGDRMIVWGGRSNSGRLDTGGVYDPATDSWAPTSIVGAPSERNRHSAVWTGSQLLVWGGWYLNNELGTGGRYDPSSDSWTPMTVSGAPTKRMSHSAVWTGQRMLVWGGSLSNSSPDELFDTGGLYDPVSDSWSVTSTTNAPAERTEHSSVWTGSRLLVWGGVADGDDRGFFDRWFYDDGARFDPATNVWTPMATPGTGLLSARRYPAVAWTGNRMLIWGGGAGGDYFGDHPMESGARYDPSTDSWSMISTMNAPQPTQGLSGVWTGDELIVWGGWSEQGFLNSGGRYDPLSDSWSPTSTAGAPSARSRHQAVWMGNEMMVWGGFGDNGYLNTGGRYDVATDSWVPTSMHHPPASRVDHTMVWTGTHVLLFGGYGGSGNRRYELATDSWSPMSTVNSPNSQFRHMAVWTGSEMLMWGGVGDGNGGRYDPVTDNWSPISTIGEPSERVDASAVWTGSELVIWGGWDGGPVFNDGARYHLASDSWTPLASENAPSPRHLHASVWTGSQLLVWGGHSNWGDLNDGGRYNLGHDSDDDNDGYSECAGDCNDGNSSVLPGATELCDGLDNDCNSSIDDQTQPPVDVNQLTLETKTLLTWQPVESGDGATYDVVRGTLGDYPVGSGAMELCLATDPTAAIAVTETPGSGEGFWYLVRARNACESGRYGEASDATERVTSVCLR